MVKYRGERVNERRKKITSTGFLTKTILEIKDKIRRIEMFSSLPVNGRSKNFLERTEVKYDRGPFPKFPQRIQYTYSSSWKGRSK